MSVLSDTRKRSDIKNGAMSKALKNPRHKTFLPNNKRIIDKVHKNPLPQIWEGKMHALILRARGWYNSTFILKRLTRKPDLRYCDWFTISIHYPRSVPKGVRTLKIHEVSGFYCGRKDFTIQVNCIIQGFVLGYWTHYFDLQSFKLFQIIVARAKKGTLFSF